MRKKDDLSLVWAQTREKDEVLLYRYERSHNSVGFNTNAQTKHGKSNTPHYGSFPIKANPS